MFHYFSSKCNVWGKLLDGMRNELTCSMVMEAKAEASIIIGVPWMTENVTFNGDQTHCTLVPYLKKEIEK